jgi:hypothetical protein
MPNVFVSLDDALIERVFQPLIELAAARLGFGRLTLACVCLDAASFTWILSRAGALTGTALAGTALAGTCLQSAILLLGLTALVALRALFRRAQGRPQANPLRHAMRPHRGVILLLLAGRMAQWNHAGVAEAADLMMLLFACAGLYLGACGERPPLRRASLKPAEANAR